MLGRVLRQPDAPEAKRIRNVLEPVVDEIMAEWTESIIGLKKL
jgi:hypothetical protein